MDVLCGLAEVLEKNEPLKFVYMISLGLTVYLCVYPFCVCKHLDYQECMYPMDHENKNSTVYWIFGKMVK